MFDLTDRPQVFIPVKWAGLVPDPENDRRPKTIEHSVEIEVEFVDKDELLEMFTQDGVDIIKATTDSFLRVAKDWRNVGIKGTAIPFNAENADRMIKFPGFDSAFALAYFAAWSGKAETREGNSEGLPPAGQEVEQPSGKPQPKPRPPRKN